MSEYLEYHISPDAWAAESEGLRETLRLRNAALDRVVAERDWNIQASRNAKAGRIKANARAEQAERELDYWMTRAYEAEKRAVRAEAGIKNVRDLHVPEQCDPECCNKAVCIECSTSYPCATISALESDT